MAFAILHLFEHLADPKAKRVTEKGWGHLWIQDCSSFTELTSQLDAYESLHQSHVQSHIDAGLWPEAEDVDAVGFSFLIRNDIALVQIGVSPLGCIVMRHTPKPLQIFGGTLSGDELIAFQLDEWTEYSLSECVSRAEALAAADNCLTLGHLE